MILQPVISVGSRLIAGSFFLILAVFSAVGQPASPPVSYGTAAHSATHVPVPARAASTPPPPSSLPATAKLVYPEFPGGDAALIAFLGQTLRYPADAYREGAEGRVDVSFWIDETGRPYGFGVVETPHPSLGEEALRALRLMPNWMPGSRDGQPLPQLVHVPVVFRRPANAK